MASAKNIVVRPIDRLSANALVKREHYSGKVVNNSQLHLGVFLDERLQGAMQFGPPIRKRVLIGLVSGTSWNGFMELNRMAFASALPKNSESRAISVAFKIIRKAYPHIEWIVSFADATQCGDGAIYRASGFVLTAIKKNTGLLRMPDGSVRCQMTMTKGKHILNSGAASKPFGAKPLSGFQLRYVYFLNPNARKRLTVNEIPFSKIHEMGAGMYLGKPKRASSKDSVASEFHSEEGGASPTDALQLNAGGANG